MTSINDILTQASELRVAISRLLRNSTYSQHGDLSALDIKRQDSEQLFLLDELQRVMEKLDDVEDVIRYIELPVDEISHLHKSSSAGMRPLRGGCSAAAT